MASVIRFPAPKPEFRLLEPPLVIAPSPLGDGQTIQLEISKSTWAKYIKAQLRLPILEAWAHLVGETPPVPNSFKMALDAPNCVPTSLANACACFKGVRRPYGEEDAGDDVHVYVISTPFTVGWSDAKDRMACVAAIKPAPEGVVMTVQVRPSSALQPTNSDVWGTITKWEFVGACAEHPELPSDYNERYNERLWPR